MPEDTQDNQQQPSSTPHFDNFSGRNDNPNMVPTPVPTPPFVDDESFSRPLVNPPESVVGVNQVPIDKPVDANSQPTVMDITAPALVDPMVSQQPQQAFAPAPIPVISPVQDSTLTPQPVAETTKSSGVLGVLKNKKIIIGIIIAVIVVILVGISALAVSLYQSPQKVITDSIIHAVTAKSAIYEGTLSTSDKDTKTDVTVKITTKADGVAGSLKAEVSVDVDGKKFSANGDAIVDKNGDLYFKVGGLEALVKEYEKSLGITDLYPTSIEAVNKLVNKIDDTWIKISSKDLEQYSEQYSKTKTCINDATEKFKDDKVAITEITDLYKKNQFMVVDKDLGQKDGSLGYKIKLDNKLSKSFGEGLKETKIYKSLNKCDDSIKIATDDSVNETKTVDDNGTFELWADMWSHKITKIVASSNSDGNVTSLVVKPQFDQKVEIETPKSSITLTELQTYVQELMTSFQADMSASYDYDTYQSLDSI